MQHFLSKLFFPEFLRDNKPILESYPKNNEIDQDYIEQTPVYVSHDPVIRSKTYHQPPSNLDSRSNEEINDPIKIIQLRYAKGEISKEDFEEMKKPNQVKR